MQIEWNNIDTVLLDMDGTLIDRYYEDYFWDTVVPRMYAKKHSMKVGDAKVKLKEIFSAQEGTKNWGSVDFWRARLDLDVDLYKKRYDLAYLIKLHPHTLEFLKFLKKSGKKLYVVSAAPDKEIAFKIKKTKTARFFEGYYSELDFGRSKYELSFWRRLAKKLNFDKERTMVVDDMEGVLQAANAYGIKYLLFKAKNSSKKPANKSKGFVHVNHFVDLL